ncbi:RNA exonuclease 1 homolog [Sipha flava]|jgi:RNA exonuclease 1|uniref:RNA exonuclease 1 n=1 Tax=Sipha flava TaxID=143950 RepID=A0A2S2RBQ3_9HEMI|nr:RNA exonuclease 1 homolog [Sipha flava]
MLPSKGYFKALECPYFTESFCDRPYCHFKHSKQDFLSDSNCQIAAKMDNNCVVILPDNSKLPEEPKLKPKVKSKIIEYVPQYIKSMNLESSENSCIYVSSAEICKNETPILEYIPSSVNETNLDFELETLNDNNKILKEKEPTEPINYSESLTTTYNISKQNSDLSEYVPTVIEKPKDVKTSKHKDSHHREHRSSSKRKHESSRKSSGSSSKSSNKSKKSKKDKSPEPKKDKSKRDHEKKHEKKIQNIRCTKLDTLTPSNSYAPKSLREAVMEKVNKKLVEIDAVKTDLSCSSDEGKGLSTTSIESDLIEYSSSEDSNSEQKPCNVVEAKLKKRISHISPSSIFAKINVRTVVRPRSSKSLHELVASRVQSIQNNDSRLPKKTEISFHNDPTLPLLKAKTRVAHQPKIEPVTSKPLTPNSSKVNNKEITADIKLCLRIKSFKSSNNMPNPLRQSCLEKLFTAFMNHYSSEEAIDKAHTTEEEVHSKAKSSGIYKNLIVQSLMKANKAPELQVKSNPYYPSHMYGVCLYDLLKKYILSKDELEKNGYPLMGDNNLAYISKNAYYYCPLSKKRNGDKFICMNCKSEFEINKRGMPIVTLSKCIYHSGKLKYERSKNEKFWLCCYKRQHESGCESSMFHVPDKLDDDALENFVVIENIKSHKNIEDPNFYALDCEMVNTTVGIEIVRVTVINHEGKEVYESKVKPSNPILDYKSKYSGITEESLKYCSKRLFDVQLDLMKIFDKESILIGHSLDSDLKALKMVHYNVVDTSTIYPHKYGPPYKWGLKFLCEQHLQRIIQSEEGHDSKEDALASLDLVWKKLKEDVKKFKPVNIISIDKR